jgi:hypothetical protein
MRSLWLALVVGFVILGASSVAEATPLGPCQVQEGSAQTGLQYYMALVTSRPTLIPLRRTCTFRCKCDLRHKRRNCHRTVTLSCPGHRCGPCKGEARRKARRRCSGMGSVKYCTCRKI